MYLFTHSTQLCTGRQKATMPTQAIFIIYSYCSIDLDEEAEIGR